MTAGALLSLSPVDTDYAMLPPRDWEQIVSFILLLTAHNTNGIQDSPTDQQGLSPIEEHFDMKKREW